MTGRQTCIPCSALFGLLLVLGWAPGLGAQAPDERWRSLQTPHFTVSFPVELEELARRAAERAERAHAGLSGLMGWSPSGRTDLVLTDHVDFSNGFANVTPWKRITIYARPPVDSETLQHFDDWLELVITHELAHVFHLDRAGWLGRTLRGILGRYPGSWPLFPGRSQPQWVIEGLPTLYESTLTDAGRVHGSEHRMLLRVAALEGALESLDRASGNAPNWPGGDRAYAYGSRFFDHVVERFGPEAIPAFVEATAGQLIPFRLNAAANAAFGERLSEVWEGWLEEVLGESDSVAAALEREAPFSVMETIGSSGRQSFSARVSPDGRWLAYARSDGRSDSQLRIVDLLEGSDRSLVRTNGVATLDWAAAGRLVFAQLDNVDAYRIRSDLYETDLQGLVRRITNGARLSHPAAFPQGGGIVAVQDGEGGSRLVLVDAGSGEVRPLSAAGPDELWSGPRVSPDGAWIAAVRWRPGGRMDVVVLTPSGRVVAEVTADRARDDAPTWSADGRWLVWASDRTGIPNILAAPFDGASGQVGSIRRVTHTAAGFRSPGLSQDGRWLYVSAYHSDGWRIERTRFLPDEGLPAPGPLSNAGGQSSAESYGEHVAEPMGAYHALPSLMPRYWEPWYSAPVVLSGQRVLGAAFGVQTSGADVVGRHDWTLSARLQPQDNRWEGAFAYSFRGLGMPILGARVSRFFDAGRLTGIRADSSRATLFTVERDQRLDVDLTLERRRWRSVAGVTLTGGLIEQERALLSDSLTPSEEFRLGLPDRRFVEGGATLFLSTARSYAFSLSAEEGISVLLRARKRSALALPDSLSGRLGFDGGFEEVLGRLRAYQGLPLPGWGNHVLALQWVGGVARGPGADAVHFDLGDASGSLESVTGLGLFGGRPRLFPLRGYAAGSRTGVRAWSGSAEYRFPLLEVRRGLGPWPLYLDRVSASVFIDAGNAWGPGGSANPRRSTLSSAGVESVSDWLPFWTSIVRIRLGLGIPLVDGSGTRYYVRVGTAF